MGHAKDGDYLDYHRTILRAEAQFLRGDRSGSLQAYQTIFSQWSRPFARDCFIALQLASLERDHSRWIYFLSTAFRNGVPRTAIHYSGAVNQYLNSLPDGAHLTDSIYQRESVVYIKTIHFEMRSYLLSLSKRDMVYHEMPKSWRGARITDSLYAGVLDQNTQEIVKLFQKTGYLGERSIGVMDPRLDGYCDGSLAIHLTPITLLFFYHHYCGYPLLSEQLRAAIQKGELHPHDYALIAEWSYEDEKKRAAVYVDRTSGPTQIEVFFKLKCTLPPRKKYYNVFLDRRTYIKNDSLVNACRQEIGMGSIEHDKLKEEYARKNRIKLFFGIGSGV